MPSSSCARPQETLLDCPARPAGADRHQGRLLDRRLRRLQRHGRRPAGVLLPDAGRGGQAASRSAPSRAWRSGEELHPLQRKFLEHAALQCGICTPGFLVAAKALLEKQARSDRDRSALLAGRQSVPLHRLRQDRPRRAGCRHRDERSLTMQEKVEGRGRAREVQVRRHPPDPARRRRQGHGPRQVRRRSRHARPAGRQGAAQPARARAHQVDRHVSAAEKLPGVKAVVTARRLQGSALRVHPGGRDDGQLPRRRAQRHGAREGAVRGPCRSRPWRPPAQPIAKQALEAHQGRLRGAAARHRRGGGDAARRAAAARGHVSPTGVEPAPKTPSNIAKRVEFEHGRRRGRLRAGRRVVEREFTTKPVHQGYIEPHACVASVSEDGQAELWCRRRATGSCARTARGCSAGTSARSA